MSKSNAAENHLIAWIFNGTPIPWAGVSMIYVSLHTADPGEAGNQSTNEASYTGYARVGLSRDSNGWALSGMGSASNRSTVSFPQCTGGSEILSHVAIGTAATGGGTLLYSGPLNASLAVSGQIQPVLGEGTLQVSES